MSDPPVQRSSLTEETPAAPAWIETELDALLAPVATPALPALRGAYLDCLAASAGPADTERAHDRCRAAFLRGLREAGVETGELDGRLAALEAELTART